MRSWLLKFVRIETFEKKIPSNYCLKPNFRFCAKLDVFETEFTENVKSCDDKIFESNRSSKEEEERGEVWYLNNIGHRGLTTEKNMGRLL